jgi:hypothetical protein
MTPVSTLLNLARGAKGIALLFFLLPWVTISCAGHQLGSATGLQLATGSAPPIALDGMPGGAPAAGAAARTLPLDYFALAAAVLIVAGLALTFVKPRRRAALFGMIAAGAAAAALLFDVVVRLKGVAEARIRAGAAGPANAGPTGLGGEFDRAMHRQIEQIANAISIDPALGFWLTVIALLGALVLLGMVYNRGETP